MDANERAVDCIAQAIVQAFSVLAASGQSAFSTGVVKSVPESGNTYSVMVRGADVRARAMNGDIYAAGDRVLVLSVGGSYTNKYIIGVA